MAWVCIGLAVLSAICRRVGSQPKMRRRLWWLMVARPKPQVAPMSQNLDRLKEAFASWHDKKGSAEAIDKWMSLFGETCRFHSLGDDQSELTFVKAAQSKAEVRAFFEGLTSALKMVHYTPWFFIEQDDRIAVLGKTGWSNPGTGAVAETMIATFWRFESGKIVELFQLYDTSELMRLMAAPAK